MWRHLSLRACMNPFHRKQLAAQWYCVGKDFQFAGEEASSPWVTQVLNTVFCRYFQYTVMVSGLYIEVCCDTVLSHL